MLEDLLLIQLLKEKLKFYKMLLQSLKDSSTVDIKLILFLIVSNNNNK
tara:strand:+ start:58 stop:201 length:144 start_codon:yes stop_codon:yes gene_type:complete